MEIQIRGRARRFAGVPSGTFFCALRSEKIFCFSVSDANGSGAFVFAKTQEHRGVPWLAPGGLPNDDLVAYPEAVIRADPFSVSTLSGPIPFGAIINADDDFHMQASNGISNIIACDLRTGVIARLPADKVFNIYRKWEVGHFEGERFEPIFTFPLPVQSQ